MQDILCLYKVHKVNSKWKGLSLSICVFLLQIVNAFQLLVFMVNIGSHGPVLHLV